jgi:hypothetical protein
MSGKESLSLDEFATAPRRQRAAAVVDTGRAVGERPAVTEAVSEPAAGKEQEKGSAAGEASKALRQVKRLKLASFNTETSMQSIMEKAIRQYLDASGY